jgi:hypothetical protein
MNHSFKIIVIPILLIGLTLCITSCKPKPTLPVVTTTNVTGITQTTATTGGNVTSDGNAEVTSRGVCWNTSENPTVSNSKTSDGTGTGAFTSSLTQLTPGTPYYVRAYATNSEGTSYGNEVTFSSNPIVLATLTTSDITSITTTTAVSGGSISNDGGGTITARGVCWNTSDNPTVANSKTSDGTGTGSFTSSLTELTPNTTYYVRAYATNSAGIAYGNNKTFTTEPQILLTIRDATSWTLENHNLSTVPNAIVKLYASQSSFNNNLPDFTETSDINGIVKLNVPIQEQYFLIVEKGDLSNIKNGYIITGVFNDQAEINAYPHLPGVNIGGLKYEDYNADGVINALDQIWHDVIYVYENQTTTETVIIGK